MACFNWTSHFWIKNVVSRVLTPISSSGTNVLGECVAYICKAEGLVPWFIWVKWFTALQMHVYSKVGIHPQKINESLKRARRRQEVLPNCQCLPIKLNGIKIQKTTNWKFLLWKPENLWNIYLKLIFFLRQSGLGNINLSPFDDLMFCAQ